MLVLTRRIGESFMISEDIKITYLGIQGSNIKLGIDAPKRMPIYRDEIFKKIMQQEGYIPPRYKEDE